MQKKSEEMMLERFNKNQSEQLAKETEVSNKSLSIRLTQLEKEKEILINDIRQETNNTIEKQNLQLTFWLSIITIFGTMIPIFIQYRLYISNREKLSQEISYYRDFVRSHALHNIAGNISYIAKTPAIVDSKNRNPILIHLIKESSEIFEEIVESVTMNYEQMLTPDVASLLLQSLFQTSIIANSVRMLGLRDERKYHREFYRISDSINRAINLVMDTNIKMSAYSEFVIRQLHCVSRNLYSLSRCLP